MQILFEEWRKFLIEDQQAGRIIAIFGPSGCGKTRHKSRLKHMGWQEIPSVVTRPPRGEIDTEYVFISEEEWHNMKENGDLINTNRYQGNYYGAHLEGFRNAIRGVMLTDITNINNSKGEQDLKNIAAQEGKELILAYCAPPSREELQRRHTKRGTPERIDVALRELEIMNDMVHAHVPDAIWINNDLDVDQLEEEYG